MYTSPWNAQLREDVCIVFKNNFERSKARSVDQTSITSSKHIQIRHCVCPLCMTRVYWGCVERAKARSTVVRANARSPTGIHMHGFIPVQTNIA